MKLNKQCKIELVASKDKTRSAIASPYLDITDGAGKMVATNGQSLVVVPVEIGTGDVAGYVSAEALAASRKTRSGEITCNGSLSVVDGPTFTRQVEGKFPNWRQVIPDADRKVKFEIAFDVTLLAAMAKAMGCESVRLSFEDNLKPIVVRPSTKMGEQPAEPEAYGVLMPMRLG